MTREICDDTRPARAMQRVFVFLISMLFAILTNASSSNAASDADIIRGFNLTVFGAEFAPLGIQSRYVRKFNGVVKFEIVNLSRIDRTASVRNFILSLNRSIAGLKTTIVPNSISANFSVYIVDKNDYIKIAREKVYRRPNANVPGKCLVQSVFSRNGIIRSDAVIVSDGGEALFKRCLAEEILQGLGPLNEHPSLSESMFNDRTKHTSFTRFDRSILNMLYDRRVKNGTSMEMVQKILPAILNDFQKGSR